LPARVRSGGAGGERGQTRERTLISRDLSRSSIGFDTKAYHTKGWSCLGKEGEKLLRKGGERG